MWFQCLEKLTLEGNIPEVPKEINQLECLEELILLHTMIVGLCDRYQGTCNLAVSISLLLCYIVQTSLNLDNV